MLKVPRIVNMGYHVKNAGGAVGARGKCRNAGFGSRLQWTRHALRLCANQGSLRHHLRFVHGCSAHPV